MDRVLRLVVLAVAAVFAVAVTTVTTLVPAQQRPTLLGSRPAAHVGPMSGRPFGGAIPNEERGRVERWENARLLAAEAEAAAAAQAKAAADARAKAAAAAAAKAKATADAKAQAGATTTTPPAAIQTFTAGSVQDIITKAFSPYGATAVAWGLRVAKCESGYNPRAYNGAGPYYGLFQFLMSTFKATPYGGQDIYDPVANASAAAWKYSQGGAGAWGCK